MLPFEENDLDRLLSRVVPASLLLLSAVYTRPSASLRKNLFTISVAAASVALLVAQDEVLQRLETLSYGVKAAFGSVFVLEMLFWALDLYRQRVYLERNKGNVDASRKR